MTAIGIELILFSFVASVIFALQLMSRSFLKSCKAVDRIGSTLAILSAAVVAVDGLQTLSCVQYQRFQPWCDFPILATLIGYSWLCLRGWSWHGRQGLGLIKQPLVGCLLLATMFMAGWSWHRLHMVDKLADFSLDYCTPGQLVEEPAVVGFTDTGSSLPIYRMEVSDEQFEKYSIAIKEYIDRTSEPLIVQAEPTNECNCHGWVFTGGKHLMRGEEVSQILQENGYSQITQPAENDIVIYRSDLGRILHTGLVRTVLADRTILVESKWGTAGRFLHRPENQPYSQDIEYYRSQRASHLITLKSTDEVGERMANATAAKSSYPVDSLSL